MPNINDPHANATPSQEMVTDEDWPIPEATDEKSERQLMMKETKMDTSLESIQMRADRLEQGYYWDDGFVKQTFTSETGVEHKRLVLPTNWRKKALWVAHVNPMAGHLSHRKTAELLKQTCA